MRTTVTKKLAVTLAAILLLGLALPSFQAFADPKAAAPAFLLGDVDMNGTVEAADARLALRAAVGLENYDYCSYQSSAADADRDGEIVAGDARLILRAAVGLEALQKGIVESCDLFSVTLPAAWQGKYIAEKDTAGIRFYHKDSRQNGYSGYLFKIYAVDQEQAKREMDMSEFAFMLDNAGKQLAVLIGRPGDYPGDPAFHTEYFSMDQNVYSIVGTFDPAAWNAYPYFRDYSDLTGFYTGTAIGDINYELTITEVRRNSVSGVLAWVPSNGDEVSTAETYFLLFDDEGLATWTDRELFYGSVRLEGDKIVLDTSGADPHWSYSPEPITFSPSESGLDPDYFNTRELTAAQSAQVMERLRGMWINDQNNYLIGFIQDGGDPDADPGWTLFCGAPQAGYDISGLVQFPVCGDPNGVVRLHTRQPEYTDIDGEYHPAIEFNIYVDLKMRNDNSISWTNEGYSWERCSYYAAHPSLVGDEYGEALSWKETKTLLESLTGVWMNDDRNYFIAFSQVDADTWEAMFGVPESEFDLTGLVTRDVYRNSNNKNKVRLTVSGSTMNGELVEVWIWLDLSLKADNTVFWSNDGNEWEACRLFCMGVDQISERLHS